MGIFDSLTKAANTFIEDINTPESFKKGEKFEKYTRDTIFPPAKYNLLNKTHNYSQNSKDFVQESLEPDFEFECKETKRKFYVEAKFRSYIHDGKIKFSYKEQFERYKEIGKSEIVFIIIGIGDDPSKPEHVYLMPLNDIDSIYLTEPFLEKYAIANNRPIAISKLEQLVKSNNNKQTKSSLSDTSDKRVYQEKPYIKQENTAYCIRCHDSLPLNIKRPLCKTCYSEWAQYENVDYKEDYCHLCGKEKDVTIAKPVCNSCYKQLYK